MKKLQCLVVGIYALVLINAEGPWRLEVSADLETWVEIDRGPAGVWMVLDNSQQPALFWRLKEDGVKR